MSLVWPNTALESRALVGQEWWNASSSGRPSKLISECRCSRAAAQRQDVRPPSGTYQDRLLKSRKTNLEKLSVSGTPSDDPEGLCHFCEWKSGDLIIAIANGQTDPAIREELERRGIAGARLRRRVRFASIGLSVHYGILVDRDHLHWKDVVVGWLWIGIRVVGTIVVMFIGYVVFDWVGVVLVLGIVLVNELFGWVNKAIGSALRRNPFDHWQPFKRRPPE